ncbi:MAG: hypothetical protein AAF360_14530 [Pseudomonadota bacterium]
MSDLSHRDYDLHDHLMCGRQLRSAAMIDAFGWVAAKLRGLVSGRRAARAEGGCAA